MPGMEYCPVHRGALSRLPRNLYSPVIMWTYSCKSAGNSTVRLAQSSRVWERRRTSSLCLRSVISTIMPRSPIRVTVLFDYREIRNSGKYVHRSLTGTGTRCHFFSPVLCLPGFVLPGSTSSGTNHHVDIQSLLKIALVIAE